jgi:hypothetical protein
MTEKQIMSRRDAHARGLDRFYTGKPCTRDHYSDRYTSNGACIACLTFKSPARAEGPRGRNVYWPTRPFAFATQPMPSPEEMEAAINYVAQAGWHDAALQELRKDPAQFERYMNVYTDAEAHKARQLLRVRNRQIKIARGEALGPEDY